jgi:hypothetical protein
MFGMKDLPDHRRRVPNNYRAEDGRMPLPSSTIRTLSI